MEQLTSFPYCVMHANRRNPVFPPMPGKTIWSLIPQNNRHCFVDRFGHTHFQNIPENTICQLGVNRSNNIKINRTLDFFNKREYTYPINSKPHPVFDPQNHQEIVLDIVSNLTQISSWTLRGFSKQHTNIDLYLRLTRKNVNALATRTLHTGFRSVFATFCKNYSKLEQEYEKGIMDHKTWAATLKECAENLTKHSHLA